MTMHIKNSNGEIREVTGLYIKQNDALEEVLSGYVRQLDGATAVADQFFTTTFPIDPATWIDGSIYWPGPWVVAQWFTVTGPGPYTWVLTESSASGGASMAIAFGQGTNTVQVRAECPGGANWGGGELTGELTVNGNTANIALFFGLIP